MLKKILGITLMLAVTSGCSTTVELGSMPDRHTNELEIVDLRKPEQKIRARESIYSPIVFYGDDSFQPPALSVFEAALASKMETKSPIKLEVTEFRIIDFFPKRLSVGVSGPAALILTGLSGYSAEDWKILESLNIPANSDVVICLVAVSVNGKSFKAAAYEPYSTGIVAITVASSDGFRRSARLAVEKAASNLGHQIRSRKRQVFSPGEAK